VYCICAIKGGSRSAARSAPIKKASRSGQLYRGKNCKKQLVIPLLIIEGRKGEADRSACEVFIAPVSRHLNKGSGRFMKRLLIRWSGWEQVVGASGGSGVPTPALLRA